MLVTLLLYDQLSKCKNFNCIAWDTNVVMMLLTFSIVKYTVKNDHEIQNIVCQLNEIYLIDTFLHLLISCIL